TRTFSSTPFILQITRQRYMSLFFFFNDTATTEIYTLSLHDALPIWTTPRRRRVRRPRSDTRTPRARCRRARRRPRAPGRRRRTHPPEDATWRRDPATARTRPPRPASARENTPGARSRSPSPPSSLR